MPGGSWPILFRRTAALLLIEVVRPYDLGHNEIRPARR